VFSRAEYLSILRRATSSAIIISIIIIAAAAAAAAADISADEDIDSTFPTNVVVSSDGGCLWVPPGMFLSTCKIDISWFPFDDQLCSMKFGSWTYDSTGIDLQLDGDSNSGDTSNFISNGEWQLIGQNQPTFSFIRSHGVQYRWGREREMTPKNKDVQCATCIPEKNRSIHFVYRLSKKKLRAFF